MADSIYSAVSSSSSAFKDGPPILHRLLYRGAHMFLDIVVSCKTFFFCNAEQRIPASSLLAIIDYYCTHVFDQHRLDVSESRGEMAPCTACFGLGNPRFLSQSTGSGTTFEKDAWRHAQWAKLQNSTRGDSFPFSSLPPYDSRRVTLVRNLVAKAYIIRNCSFSSDWLLGQPSTLHKRENIRRQMTHCCCMV